MQPDPAWHYLPGNPRAFFGLTGSATREDLKSAYGQCIRRFKPDQYPNEFKKIRAAFDLLDRELRTGVVNVEPPTQTPPHSDVKQWLEREPTLESPAPSIQNEDQSTQLADTVAYEADSQDLTPRAAAYLRIGSTDPKEWYQELLRQPNKSPYDYFVLASLADVLPHADQSFAMWIADGVIAHPRDTQLASLFHALLNDKHLASDEIRELVLRIARGTTPSHFYATTDGLWKRFVVIAPWEDVDATLQACEREWMARGQEGKLPFMIGLMNKAMWRAPIAWLHERKRMIEESHESIQNELEFEHELNCKLLLLREKHVPRLESNPFGRNILAAIRSVSEDSEQQATRNVCQCQLDVLARSQEFLAAFPFDPNEDAEWAQAWTWISWIALSKLATQEGPGEQQWVLQNIYDTMRSFDARFPRSVDQLVGLMNIAASIVYVMTSLFLILILVLGASLTSMAVLGLNSQAYMIVTMGAMVIGLLISIWFVRKVQKKWQSNIIHPYIRNQVTKHYTKHWRGKLAFLMRRLMCPYHFLTGSVQQIGNTAGSGVGVSKWLVQLMPHDLGLILYSAAVPFAR
ncbi:MAG: hypothetical protein ACK5OB_16950 [Pirellula sp.]